MKVKRIVAIVAVSLLPVWLGGCTLLFTTAGINRDLRSARMSETVTWQHADSMRPRKPVRVHMVNGDTVSGQFRGVVRVADSAYAANYANAQAARRFALPSLGDTLTLVYSTGRQSQAIFAGFGANTVLVRPSPSGNRVNVSLAVGHINSLIDAAGEHLARDTLVGLMASHQIPLAQAVELRVDGITRLLPLQKVHSLVSTPHRTHYWALGLGAGLVVDGALIYLATQDMRRASWMGK